MPTIMTVTFKPNIPSLFLFGWGDNTASGMTGQGTTVGTTASPTQIGSSTWAQVAVGQSTHVVGVQSNGTLWSWGNDSNGQGGRGGAGVSSTPQQVGSDTNWSTTFPSATSMPKVSAGGTHSHVIKTDGTLWGTGINTQGQLGTGDTTSVTSFVQIGSDTDWVGVASTGASTIALKSNGTLWATGTNQNGQTAQGTTSGTLLSFTQIGSDTDWAFVTGGNTNYHAIKTDGTMYAWGLAGSFNGEYDTLGINVTSTSAAARAVENPTLVAGGAVWAHSSLGQNHGAAVRTDGTLWTWGLNSSGQRGVGTNNTANNTFVPSQVGSDTDWLAVSSGETNNAYSLAIKTDGTLWAWGANNNDQLGNGTSAPASWSPVQVGVATDWVQVASGAQDVSLGIRNVE